MTTTIICSKCNNEFIIHKEITPGVWGLDLCDCQTPEQIKEESKRQMDHLKKSLEEYMAKNIECKRCNDEGVIRVRSSTDGWAFEPCYCKTGEHWEEKARESTERLQKLYNRLEQSNTIKG